MSTNFIKIWRGAVRTYFTTFDFWPMRKKTDCYLLTKPVNSSPQFPTPCTACVSKSITTRWLFGRWLSVSVSFFVFFFWCVCRSVWNTVSTRLKAIDLVLCPLYFVLRRLFRPFVVLARASTSSFTCLNTSSWMSTPTPNRGRDFDSPCQSMNDSVLQSVSILIKILIYS